jgi:cell division septal protein FtsQ
MRLRPFLRRFRADFFIVARFVAATGVVTGLLVGAAWGGYTQVWPAMVSHSYFRLRSVKVFCDSPAEQPTALAARAGLYDGTSLWDIDPGAARRGLASVPWVRDARIFRLFPDQVAVEVFRRDPVALTVVEGTTYMIDREGVVYREGDQAPNLDLPLLTGWNDAAEQADRVARLRAEMGLAQAIERAGVSISQVHVDADGTFWVYPDGRQVRVALGLEPKAQLAARRLSALWSTLPMSEDLREIDLSYPDRVVLRTAAGRVRGVISAMVGAREGAVEVSGRG